jgi:hypothetical protein
MLAGPAVAFSATLLLQDSAETVIRLVRSVAGTRGSHRNDGFEVEDPRAVFSLPQDRQILVYFEWEGGAPGMRHCEGRWKDPSGAVVLVAPVDQRATGRRFGLYWTLALADTVASGLWALEVLIDGRPAGTHAFEVRGGRAAVGLSAAQLYDRALNAAATVERVGGMGEVSGLGIATPLEADFVTVPFDVVDGASRLRLALPDGRRLETHEVGAWSRREGWASLRVPGHGLTALPRGKATGVGEELFVLDTNDDGSRVIGKTTVVGEARAPATGRRLVLADRTAAGSPVLNGAGEQVGVTSPSGEMPLGETGSLVYDTSVRHSRVGTLLSMDAMREGAVSSAGTTLAELAAQGHFMRALSPERRHVVSGVFAGKVERGRGVPTPQDQRTSFARGEGRLFVFVQMAPQDRREAASTYEVYDADNKLVIRSPPAQLKLRANAPLFLTWEMPIDRLAPATYRVDALLGAAPVWRGWVRVTN